MKTIFSSLLLLSLSIQLLAQKVDVKDDKLTIDGTPVAQFKAEKGNFGLTKNFEISSLAGKKLIIAVPATEFEQDQNDNSYLYYRLTFLTSNQVGIFNVSALGQQKNFIKLIGTSGIFEGDSTSDSKVMEFIAKKSSSPKAAVDYTQVPRNRIYPVQTTEDKTFTQKDKVIGRWESKGEVNGVSYYDIYLPSGVLIAKVSFTGGNDAQNVDVYTAKDNYKRIVPFPKEGKTIAASASVEKYWMTMRRIGRWLAEKNYM